MIRLYTYFLGYIKILIYKLCFGRSLKIPKLVKFSHKASLRIRHGGKIILGKVSIGSGTAIRVTAGAEFSMGNGSGFNSNCIVTCREKILIGNNVLIGSGVSFYDHDHIYKTDKLMKHSGYITAPIIVEDNVWIGANVIILKGVKIESGSVIAAGTVVTKDIPANSLVYNKHDTIIKRYKN